MVAFIFFFIFYFFSTLVELFITFSVSIQLQYGNSLFSCKWNKNFLFSPITEDWLLLVLWFLHENDFILSGFHLYLFKVAIATGIFSLPPKSKELIGPLSISFNRKIYIITLLCRSQKTLRTMRYGRFQDYFWIN